MTNDDFQALIPQVGKILIASPFLDGTDFERTVILLITYENGYMGIVVNKLSEWNKSVNELVQDFNDVPELPVYNGGVVDKDVLFCMHTNPHVSNSLPLGNGIFINGDFPDLVNLTRNTEGVNSNVRFFLGYAGWSEGQLEREIQQGSWAVANADAKFLFTKDISSMWSTALQSVGEPYCYWVQFPHHPLIN